MKKHQDLWASYISPRGKSILQLIKYSYRKILGDAARQRLNNRMTASYVGENELVGFCFCLWVSRPVKLPNTAWWFPGWGIKTRHNIQKLLFSRTVCGCLSVSIQHQQSTTQRCLVTKWTTCTHTLELLSLELITTVFLLVCAEVTCQSDCAACTVYRTPVYKIWV